MRENIISLFASYTQEIIFLHILSAIIWVGGMIAIRLAVHPTLQSIDDVHIKLGKTLMLMGRFFHIVIPFILIVLLSAVLMIIGFGFTDMKDIVYIKEGIWILMLANFVWMYIKRAKAQRLFDTGDLAGAKASLALIPKLLLPINIILGIVALWFGVSLRGV